MKVWDGMSRHAHRRKMVDVRLSQRVLLSVGRGRQRYHVTVQLDRHS